MQREVTIRMQRDVAGVHYLFKAGKEYTAPADLDVDMAVALASGDNADLVSDTATDGGGKVPDKRRPESTTRKQPETATHPTPAPAGTPPETRELVPVHKVPGVGRKLREKLEAAGYLYAHELAEADVHELATVESVGRKAEAIRAAARALIGG